MKFWYIVLKLSPAFIVLCGLALALVNFITLSSMPPEMREMLPAGGAFVLLPALVTALFSVVCASAFYWLGRLVDRLIPEVKN
jgi:hypothetical protein